MPTASGILCATHTPQEKPDTVNIANFITELFCKVDDAIPDTLRHFQAILSISEVVTIGILYAVKDVRQRAFSPGSATTTYTCSANCRHAPACSAAGTPSATGPDASWPPPR